MNLDQIKKVILVTVAAMSLAMASNAQDLPGYLPPDGLVGWWPFNGNAKDESGKENDGVLDGATLTNDRWGNEDQAFFFDGGSSSISVPNSPWFNFEAGNSFSFAYWVKASSFTANYVSVILSKQVGGGLLQDGVNSSIDVNQGSTFRIQNGGSTPSYALTTTDAIDIGSWIHIAQVWTGEEGRIYVNGILAATSVGSALVGDNDADLLIGEPGWTSPNSLNFHGSIDDIGIWNRALTPEEITALHLGCSLEVAATPAMDTAILGGSVFFKASCNDPAATYRWQSAALGLDWRDVPDNATYSGARTDSLSVRNIRLSHHHQSFRVVATAGTCTDTSQLTLISVADTCFIPAFDTVTIFVGTTDTLVIDILADGQPPPGDSVRMWVYPDPGSAILYIAVEAYDALAGYWLMITDAEGFPVYATMISQPLFEIDLLEWSGPGVYTLTIRDSVGTIVETRTIIIR